MRNARFLHHKTFGGLFAENVACEGSPEIVVFIDGDRVEGNIETAVLGETFSGIADAVDLGQIGIGREDVDLFEGVRTAERTVCDPGDVIGYVKLRDAGTACKCVFSDLRDLSAVVSNGSAERGLRLADLGETRDKDGVKETINKVIRQPSEWEKIIANEATDK